MDFYLRGWRDGILIVLAGHGFLFKGLVRVVLAGQRFLFKGLEGLDLGKGCSSRTRTFI